MNTNEEIQLAILSELKQLNKTLTAIGKKAGWLPLDLHEQMMKITGQRRRQQETIEQGD